MEWMSIILYIWKWDGLLILPNANARHLPGRRRPRTHGTCIFPTTKNLIFFSLHMLVRLVDWVHFSVHSLIAKLSDERRMKHGTIEFEPRGGSYGWFNFDNFPKTEKNTFGNEIPIVAGVMSLKYQISFHISIRFTLDAHELNISTVFTWMFVHLSQNNTDQHIEFVELNFNTSKSIVGFRRWWLCVSENGNEKFTAKHNGTLAHLCLYLQTNITVNDRMRMEGSTEQWCCKQMKFIEQTNPKQTTNEFTPHFLCHFLCVFESVEPLDMHSFGVNWWLYERPLNWNYLNSWFNQIDFLSYFFAHKYVRISCFVEQFL